MSPFSTSEVRDRYRRLAPSYDRSLILLRLCGFRERYYRRQAVASLSLRPGDSVVDLGCGTGRNFPMLQAAVGPQGRILGVDLTAGMLRQADRLAAAHRWRNVELVEADAASYDVPRGVGGILSTFAVTLVPTYDDVLRRAAEALAPGGRLAVLDLKLPERWPAWLVRLVARACRPYAVTLDLADRHAWESVHRYTDGAGYREFYFGAIYLSAGTSRLPPKTREKEIG